MNNGMGLIAIVISLFIICVAVDTQKQEIKKMREDIESLKAKTESISFQLKIITEADRTKTGINGIIPTDLQKKSKMKY